MTENHPLNDEICESFREKRIHEWGTGFSHENMRAAADWQLEQMIKWIQVNLEKQDGSGRYVYENDFYGAPICAEKFLGDLRKAMRPQQQEDNS